MFFLLAITFYKTKIASNNNDVTIGSCAIEPQYM